MFIYLNAWLLCLGANKQRLRGIVMLIHFLQHLKHSGIKVSITEWLDLIRAMSTRVYAPMMDDFYLLCRICLIKDESQYDRFDKAFSDFFEGLRALPDPFPESLPNDWLNNPLFKDLSDEEKAKIQSMGGLDALMKAFKERLEEQKKRHQGGRKWIGTGGTSAFGHGGYNPEGIRMGGEGRHNKAVKVWDKRQYKNLDGSSELGTRNIKIALRALRRFARTGAAQELDLDDTILSTARNAGFLDIKMRAERHNAVKVLLLFDVGGSMDAHVRTSEELFSACKSEFKHLEYYYFHNFIYDSIWRDNSLNRENTVSLFDIMNTYDASYKLIFVGDASMSPYEISHPYGSIDFINEQPGSYWFQKMSAHFNKIVWLNPVTQSYWPYVQSVGIVQELLGDRMFPLTVEGIHKAIKVL